MQRISLLKIVKILLKAREDVLNSFKSNLFLIMSGTTPSATHWETSINEDYFINEIKMMKNVQVVKYFMDILDIKIRHFWQKI